jgi:hypothetical protein
VDVVDRVDGEVKVDHMVHCPREVQSPGRDVGGNHNGAAAAGAAAGTRLLLAPTGQRGGRICSLLLIIIHVIHLVRDTCQEQLRARTEVKIKHLVILIQPLENNSSSASH